MKLLALLAFVSLVPACPPLPVPPPQPDAPDASPPPPTDAGPDSYDAADGATDGGTDVDASPVFPSTPCGKACSNAYALGCPQNSPQGTLCTIWLCDAPSYAMMSSAMLCIAKATSKAAIRKCGARCE